MPGAHHVEHARAKVFQAPGWQVPLKTHHVISHVSQKTALTLPPPPYCCAIHSCQRCHSLLLLGGLHTLQCRAKVRTAGAMSHRPVACLPANLLTSLCSEAARANFLPTCAPHCETRQPVLTAMPQRTDPHELLDATAGVNWVRLLWSDAAGLRRCRCVRPGLHNL